MKPSLKHKHCWCKAALADFGKAYPTRVGSPLGSIFYSSCSLNLRVVLHHYKWCYRLPTKWATVCKKYKGDTRDLEQVKEVIGCIIIEDDEEENEEGDHYNVEPKVPDGDTMVLDDHQMVNVKGKINKQMVNVKGKIDVDGAMAPEKVRVEPKAIAGAMIPAKVAVHVEPKVIPHWCHGSCQGRCACGAQRHSWCHGSCQGCCAC